jgi:hypothetical protein
MNGYFVRGDEACHYTHVSGSRTVLGLDKTHLTRALHQRTNGFRQRTMKIRTSQMADDT